MQATVLRHVDQRHQVTSARRGATAGRGRGRLLRRLRRSAIAPRRLLRLSERRVSEVPLAATAAGNHSCPVREARVPRWRG